PWRTLLASPDSATAEREREELRLVGVLHSRGVADADPRLNQPAAGASASTSAIREEAMIVFVLPILLLFVLLPVVLVALVASAATQPQPRRVERPPSDD